MFGMNAKDVKGDKASAVRDALLGKSHSIRTRYSLATAAFLLIMLLAFYIGGRIVIVHMMRDAEDQAKDIGQSISNLAYRNAELARDAAAGCVGRAVAMLRGGRGPGKTMDAFEYAGLSLVAELDGEGRLVRGAARRADGTPAALAQEDVSAYRANFSRWISRMPESMSERDQLGIVRVLGVSHYVSLQRIDGGDTFALVGARFDPVAFSEQVNAGTRGLKIRITDRHADAAANRAKWEKKENPFGLAPMLSETMNFYSGGFWEFDNSPFETVFAVRDIAGVAITMITVSLPQTLNAVTKSALSRLTFFISMCGIVVVLPLFLFQAWAILNPLTKMTRQMRLLAASDLGSDCPRIKWKGDDEFARLAESVNRLLETISARTVALGQMETRQRALIGAFPDALFAFDKSGKVVSVVKQPDDAKPVPGLSMRCEPDESVFSAAGVAELRAALDRAFGSGEVSLVKLVAAASEGSAERRFEVRVVRMDDSFALAVARDVTSLAAEHRLRVEAERRSLDASKRESLSLFAAGIAHDMNNVLSVILNTVEAVHAAAPSASNAAADALEAVRRAVMRGSAMAKELMAYAGDAHYTFRRTTVSSIMYDVKMLARGALPSSVEMTFMEEEDAPDVDTDSDQFWKVLFNLVKNAADAIGASPGHIIVSAEAFQMTEEAASAFASLTPLSPGPGTLFKVSDNGPGIDAAVLSRMFDPYVSSRATGRGLGLATVRSIVEAHDGGIRVVSESGNGTEIGVFLPASCAARSYLESAPKSGAADGGRLPSTVLIVDDDKMILKTCSMLLKSLGVSAVAVSSRRDALAALHKSGGGVGAVLLDADLGGIAATLLLKSIRAVSPGTPVIVSSGEREDVLRAKFSAEPCDGFLLKPYTVAELRAALANVTAAASAKQS